ncbi:MAG: energy transducer TonB [Candidatus Methanofastidiosum sp.]|nr:energy transducer TonB [Methanofastidiosum sp.]
MTIILGIIIYSAFGQTELKRIKIKDKEKSVVETYYVLKNDRNIKNGEYSRFVNNKKVTTGQYANNKKTGIWTYYDTDNSVDLKYDYDKDSVIFVNIQNDTSELDRPTIYLGSLYEARYTIMTNLRYPEVAVVNGKSGRILIDIFINKEGDVYDYKVQKSVYPALDNEALRVVKLIPQKWLPSIKSGEPIESKYTFPVIFVLQ